MRPAWLLVVVAFGCSHAARDEHGFDGGKPGDAGFADGGRVSADGGPASGASCSGDLRSIVGTSGSVVATCPPDEGCAGGACVAACDAAAASKGSLGCDYVLPTPSFYAALRPPCWAVFVANSWPEPITLTVERSGTSYDATQFGRIAAAGVEPSAWAAIPPTGIPQGAVGVLFMSHDPTSMSIDDNMLTCPVAPAVSQTYGTALDGSGDQPDVTGRGQAFHIVASAPVTVYDILPFGGAASYLPSASLLFPSTSWGTNYLGIVATRGVHDSPQWGQLVASADDTQVMVQPSVTLPSSTDVTAAPANMTTVFTLSAGEYIQWQDSMEMSGSVIASNKPVGFIGGTTEDCYQASDTGIGGCDSAHQEIPPISAFGSSYAVAPFTTRRADLVQEAGLYRFVGAVAGTTLTFDPPSAAAPATLAVGQVVDFELTGPFTVTSQDAMHPFYVAQLMPGCDVMGGSRQDCSTSATTTELGCCLGDEEYVNVLPPAQYLSSYVFFTDPSYPTTNLVFTRAKVNGAFADVTLDCLGSAPLTGWAPIDSSDSYEYTNVDLVRGNTPNGACNNGPHSASSSAAFGVTVWGLDTYSSYAYPAGGNIGAINPVVVDPIQ